MRKGITVSSKGMRTSKKRNSDDRSECPNKSALVNGHGMGLQSRLGYLLFKTVMQDKQSACLSFY